MNFGKFYNLSYREVLACLLTISATNARGAELEPPYTLTSFRRSFFLENPYQLTLRFMKI